MNPRHPSFLRKLALVAGALATACSGAAWSQTMEASRPAATATSAPLSSLGAPADLRALSTQAVPDIAPGAFFEVPQPTREELIAGAQAERSRASLIAPSLATANSPTYFQTTLGTLPVTITKNFDGLGRGFNGNWTDQFIVPPDTTLAVGPNHIVQWVNVRLTVLNKAGTPLIGGALGYVNGNAIWQGLPAGSICRLANRGDPVVTYDRQADRWMLTQFAFDVNVSGNPVAPFAQCFAVSTTGDPTGTYSLYEYQFDHLPDYGKLGVWWDAYYFTYNGFTINPTSGASAFVGARSCALDRTAMIAGTPATLVCTPLMTNRFSILPAHLEGGTPPPGAPNYQVSQDWFFFASPPYSIRLQKFKVDFINPANSTFTDGLGGAFNSFVQMPMGSLLGACGDNGGACVAQPGTARVLDTLSMRPMYPLKYRNRGGVESLVFTHTIDPIVGVSGTQAAMNWVEIRDPGGSPPVMRQNGAINTPDALNRWMGSASMDKMGNIALGYSVSSASVNPGIRIAGRLNSDIVSRLRGEAVVVNGRGAQTSTAQRWGDYSTMQVDPADDCTFWYTQQYMQGTFTRDWSTRIVGFKFNNCQ